MVEKSKLKRELGTFEEAKDDLSNSESLYDTLRSQLSWLEISAQALGANSSMTCICCGDANVVGDLLMPNVRKETRLLAFWRSTCVECLQHHDGYIDQDRCGFDGCEWVRPPKRSGCRGLYGHWEKQYSSKHAPKTTTCDFPGCRSTVPSKTFNLTRLHEHQ